MLLDEIAIVQVLLNDDVHHAESERGVGSGDGLQVQVRALRAQGLLWIDGDDLRAASASFLDESPGVRRRDGGIGAPNDHELAVNNVFGQNANFGAQRGFVSRRRSAA